MEPNRLGSGPSRPARVLECAETALYDLDREAYVVRHGWHVLRLPARDVLGRPDVVADRVRYERAARLRASVT